MTIADVQSVCGHHSGTDAVFVQGYSALLEGGLEGKRVLEVCCGEGQLAGWLAQNPAVEVVAIDSSAERLEAATRQFGSLSNVNFICGDAANLSRFPAESFDVVVGQASMHHLANNLSQVSKEFSRVLRAGGKALFIYEPLGHNPVVAAIRGIRGARAQWLDESNLFEWALRDFSECFTRYEVFYFSLLAYPCKALPPQSRLTKGLYQHLNALDQRVFERWPRSRKYAANCNVCYWK